jgi:hypothetical protein
MGASLGMCTAASSAAGCEGTKDGERLRSPRIVLLAALSINRANFAFPTHRSRSENQGRQRTSEVEVLRHDPSPQASASEARTPAPGTPSSMRRVTGSSSQAMAPKQDLRAGRPSISEKQTPTEVTPPVGSAKREAPEPNDARRAKRSRLGHAVRSEAAVKIQKVVRGFLARGGTVDPVQVAKRAVAL